MRTRCLNESCEDYADYGGRGITFDARWETFENFLADMGRCPLGLSLNRKENNGNYTPTNCEWADAKTQNRNRRNAHLVTWQGRTQNVSAWAEEIGIAADTLLERLKRWSVEKSLTTPLQRQGSKGQPVL